MSRKLHSKPSLHQLKRQAKELHTACRKGDPAVCAWIKKLLPRLKNAGQAEVWAGELSLSEAQLVVARGYGFDSWPKLKMYVESISSDFDAKVFHFLNVAVPDVNANHRSGNLDQAKAALVNDRKVARADIFTAVVVGDVKAAVAFLRQNPRLATEQGGPRNWTPLLYLTFSRFLRFEAKRALDFAQAAQVLLENGADPNTYFMAGDEKETVLYGAAGVANNPEVMKVLLEAGADPEDPDAHYHVAEFDNLECFRLFFDYGISAAGRATMLLRKLDFDASESVRYLLELGCDPNDVGDWGKAALHQAILRGRPVEFIGLLIKYGADVNVCMSDGKSAYRLAARNGRDDVVELLKRHGANDDSNPIDRFIGACHRLDDPMIRAFLQNYRGSIKTLSQPDQEILVNIAKTGKTKTVEMLLDADFNVRCKGAMGATALHWAAWYGHADTVRLLLAHDAPLDITDETYHITPLAWAVDGSTKCDSPGGSYVEVAQAMLAAGAKVTDTMISDASSDLKAILLKFKSKRK